MMPTKRKPSAPLTTSSDLPDAFQRHLQAALENFHQAEWLGDHSHLSAPYFLGQRPANLIGALQRGQTLQRLLRQANDSLKTQDHEAQDSSRLIDLAYLRAVPLSVEGVAAELNLSRATFYRRREQALQHLAAAFIRQINPALRLDRPPQPERLIGRDEVRAACLRALRQGRSIGLSGPAGIGKTALGATLAFALHSDARDIFWYTFIPGLNDQLDSLLFALGLFLRQHSAVNLWAQLIADQGKINLAVLPKLLHLDLQELSDSPPLLCFDDLDLLRPDAVEIHAQLITLLESLRHECPCLFSGQRPLIEVSEQYALDGFDVQAAAQQLAVAGIELTDDDVQQLVQHTGGNPRWLELFIGLHRAGEPIGEVLARLPTSPSIEFLLNRIWQHLDEAEQQLLIDLAPFRRPAPADAWEQQRIVRLIDRRLITRQPQGSLALLPALREIVWEQLPVEARRSVHVHAAGIRAARAEYTAAADHLLQASEPRAALWMWQLHSREEINQGQGRTALALLERIDPDQLETIDRDMLALTLGELRKLAGGDPRAELRHMVWHSPVLQALALRLEGDLAELKGPLDEAIAAYQTGLDSIENLLAEKALFDKNLAWTYIRQGGAGLETAWQKASLARFEAERLQGDIKWRLNDFAQAEIYYTGALALAESLVYLDGQAKTHNHLATVYAKQGKLEAATLHRGQAIILFEQIGNHVHLAGAKLNMAFDHNLIGQQRAIMPPAAEALRPIFTQAVEMASAALVLFEQLGQSHGQIIAAQNLAEAYLYLGDLPAAESYAQRVIAAQSPGVLPDGLRTLGEIRLEQRDFAGAETAIRESMQFAHDNRDHYLEAYGLRALLRVYLAQQNGAIAQAMFEQAVDLFESLDLPQEVERTQLTWQRY
jgi:hypothetical protein